MTTLTEQAEEYAEPLAPEMHRAIRRAFMAGALAALTDKRPRDTLLAECIGYGRAIGTAAERAQP